MGLDTSHDCWHGGYSAFTRWRESLIEAAGYHFRQDGHYRVMGEINWEAITDENIMGEWEHLPEDPLIVLVAHSDCEGELPVQALTPLADRLEELLPKLDGRDGGGHIGDYGSKTRRFVEGLRAAAAAGEPVRFH